MRTLYSRAFYAYKTCFPAILFFAALESALDYFIGGRSLSSIIPVLILYSYAIHLMHSCLLSEGQFSLKADWLSAGPEGAPDRQFWINWGLVAILPIFVVVLGGLFYAEMLQNSLPALTALGFAGLAIIGSILALFGTSIPAAVMKKDSQISQALPRAKATFFFVLIRLIIGPVLFVTALILAWLGLVSLDIISLWSSGIGKFIEEFIATILGYFTMALTAAALTLAYQKAEGAD